MSHVRRALPDVLAAAGVALCVYVFFGHSFLNYDSAYALVWGDELASGEAPGYDAPVAPTPHPLLVAIGALLSPLADPEAIVLAAVVAAVGAICVGLYRLGAELWAWPVGVLAAAIFATRVPPLNFGIRGYVDLPTIALVVWAAVLEARRPRRGAPVLALLAVAGLLRPEAWLYAAAYWLWLVVPLPGGLEPRLPARTALGERVRLGALAAAAPLLWMLSDLLATGDALWSLHGTSDLAAELERPRGLDVFWVVPRRLGEIVRLPELVAAVAGAGIGLALMRWRTALPLAVCVLNGLAFCVFAVAGLPLLGRYLFLTGAMLSLLAAVAMLGWSALPEGHGARRRWRAAGLALAAVAVLAFPLQVGRLDDLRDDIAARDRVSDDLRVLVESAPAERALARCGELFVPNHRPVPNLALWTGRAPERIVSARLRRPDADGLFLEPASAEVEELSLLDPRDPARFDAERPAAYRLVARNRSWRLWAGCAGA